MLYRNLALLLKPDHAVYGLQPRSRENAPIVHTRIAEMAAYHIDKIRSVQPQGPYLRRWDVRRRRDRLRDCTAVAEPARRK